MNLKNNILKYKYLYLSVFCLSIITIIMCFTNSNKEYAVTETSVPLNIYSEKDENKLEVNFSCIDIEQNKVTDVKEKVSLNKYLQNPEYTLVKEYFNYAGKGNVVSPICNKINVDKVYLDGRVLKIDLIEIGEKKYQEEKSKKIEDFNNDMKLFALTSTLKQLKDVDEYKITLNGQEVKELSYIKLN